MVAAGPLFAFDVLGRLWVFHFARRPGEMVRSLQI